MIKKIRQMISDENRSIQERLFILLTVFALFIMFILNIIGVIIGESALSQISMSVGFLVFLVLILFALKFGHLNIIAPLISFIVICILMPIIFFAGGGIYGGSPLWFIFCALFVSLTISGKIKYLLLILNTIVSAICYYVGFTYPSLITEHTTDTAYQDSFTSLLAVSAIVCTMVIFEISALQKAIDKSKQQKEEIDALNKAQNKFFSNMSHEIRTPINTIIGLNEMILREDISEEVADDAENISAASKMLLSLINDILDMSKIESGQMSLSKSTYMSEELLSDIVSLLLIRSREKGLDFHVDVDPNLPRAFIGDEIRIKQILINVLSNSVKYTNTGSISLSVSFRRDEERGTIVTFSVSDTGIGIKKENIPYLFSAFKRMDEDKNKYIEGTGLGLSIVQQLVELMNGSISVNSIYTKGTTFFIELPQEVADSEPIGELNLEKRQTRGFDTGYHRRFEAPDVRILAVDDNPTNLLVVTKLLRETRVQIDTAESGAIALSKTLENNYHLILMDHLMPEMDGIQCMHAIKDQPGGTSKNSRFIALTANSGSGMQAFYTKAGFDGYLLKPFSGYELEEILINNLPKDLLNLSEGNIPLRESNDTEQKIFHKRVNIMITAENLSDIPESLRDNKNISIIPYHLKTDKADFFDGMDVYGRDLADYLSDINNVAYPKEPSVTEYENFFASCLLNANNIIHISISSKLGKAYESARTAAEAFETVRVIDSYNLSSGIGLLVLEAERLVREGRDVDQIVDRVCAMRPKISTNFIVEDTVYLARSGLMNNTVNQIAKAFYLRPVFTIKKGKITPVRIILGGKERLWKKFVLETVKARKNQDTSILIITHVGLITEELKELEETIKQNSNFQNIIFCKASSAISVNGGPGTFGLIFKNL